MKNKKILRKAAILTVALTAATTFSSPYESKAQSYHGCWPASVKRIAEHKCPGLNYWVLRCDCGGGYCQPSWQDLCP